MENTLDVERLGEIFEGIEGHLDKITKWEQTFVDSVKDQWERKGSLSEAQLGVLEKIWLKI